MMTARRSFSDYLVNDGTYCSAEDAPEDAAEKSAEDRVA